MSLTDMPVSRASTSPRSSAAQRSRAQTRERLLAAGRKLFAERGLHGVTTHDLAADAGVAAGTFYLHFSDKAALFREIAGETIALLRAQLDAATRSARSAREGVPAFSEALIARAVFYQLVEHGVEEKMDGDHMFGVWSKGCFFPIGTMPDEQ